MSPLLPLFTGLSLLYYGTTGKGWEPLAFWLSTISLTMSFQATSLAISAKRSVEELEQKYK